MVWSQVFILLSRSEFNNGFSNGRSGTIIIDNDQYPQISLQSSFDITSPATEDVQLFNIVSRGLNLPRVETKGIAPEMSNLDVFTAPKGNFFFSFDGLALGMPQC